MSLTNEVNLIIEAALDSISENLKVDCCWIQLVNADGHGLHLVSSRGFTDDMQSAMSQISLSHQIGREVVGLGHNLIIPDLSQNGHYDMSAFEKEGFFSLIIVPIMTYKAQGILGTGSRERKRTAKDFSQLFAVIASIIGMAINKCMLKDQSLLNKRDLKKKDSILPDARKRDDSNESPVITENTIDSGLKRKRGDNPEVFQKHTHRMDNFRKLHKT
ncbi:GAF domain-containing protein [Chloroflexota bacterium]